jgi:hypothetical protein
MCILACRSAVAVGEKSSVNLIVVGSNEGPAQAGIKPIGQFSETPQIESSEQTQLFYGKGISFMKAGRFHRIRHEPAEPLVGDQSSKYPLNRFL